MSGGRASRQKGGRFERAAVALFQDHGIAAERVPLSGAAGGSFTGDLSVPILGADRKIEAKIRAGGFKRIYSWLAGNYAVVYRRDRDEPLITLRLADFAELAIAADMNRPLAAGDAQRCVGGRVAP